MNKRYDVVIIGAGSVGVPAAYAISREGLKVAVIDELPSVGQGQNKRAIGGIRATHTTPAKIHLCQDSIKIISNWEEKYETDIEWFQGGYVFVAFTEEHEKLMKENLLIQKAARLNINWVDRDKIIELVPGINQKGLRGGTYSPEDGNSSPLKTIHAIYKQSVVQGTDYHFKETVVDIQTQKHQANKVVTNKEEYETDFIINAAGAYAKKIGEMVGVDLPVFPDSHESGISEPVEKFIAPLIVDMRPDEVSDNFYFYQNKEGKFILCLTPKPLIPGTNLNETSVFLPNVARRLIKLLPRTKNLKMRRTWRGLYPMTPDGSPIIGKINNLEGYINAVGMCGQGFMLGTGIGELLSRIVLDKTSQTDDTILKELSFYRTFGKVETLK